MTDVSFIDLLVRMVVSLAIGSYARYFWLLIGIALAVPQIVALSTTPKRTEIESADETVSLGQNEYMNYAE